MIPDPVPDLRKAIHCLEREIEIHERSIAASVDGISKAGRP